MFGRGFGFVLGAVAFFASALITGGVGPWLPFQMLAAGWVGFGAGCLPPLRGFPERLMLAAYGVVSALVYGLIINFWFWPFVGVHDDVLVRAGLGTIANLHRYMLFDLTTSMGFDLTRAVTCAVLILVLGRPVLAALRRPRDGPPSNPRSTSSSTWAAKRRSIGRDERARGGGRVKNVSLPGSPRLSRRSSLRSGQSWTQRRRA